MDLGAPLTVWGGLPLRVLDKTRAARARPLLMLAGWRISGCVSFPPRVCAHPVLLAADRGCRLLLLLAAGAGLLRVGCRSAAPAAACRGVRRVLLPGPPCWSCWKSMSWPGRTRTRRVALRRSLPPCSIWPLPLWLAPAAAGFWRSLLDAAAAGLLLLLAAAGCRCLLLAVAAGSCSGRSWQSPVEPRKWRTTGLTRWNWRSFRAAAHHRAERARTRAEAPMRDICGYRARRPRRYPRGKSRKREDRWRRGSRTGSACSTCATRAPAQADFRLPVSSRAREWPPRPRGCATTSAAWEAMGVAARCGVMARWLGAVKARATDIGEADAVDTGGCHTSLPPGLHHHGQHRRLAGGCAQGVREPQVAGHEHLDADGRDREPGRRLSARRA